MAKSGRKSLKAALLSQQDRLKQKKVARVAEERVKKHAQTKGKGKATSHGGPPLPVIPFYPTDRILLIGEGNFSFARALVMHPPTGLESLPPANVTATTYDTEEKCCLKYPDAQGIIFSLREKGVEVLFEVDATRLEKCPLLKGRQWNRVVWNFPHAGKGIADQDRNILSNQLLILGFLRSAAQVLALGRTPSVHTSRKRKRNSNNDDEPDVENDVPQMLSLGLHSPGTRGTLMITLRNVPPYTLWDIPGLAKHPPASSVKLPPPYTLLRSFEFHRWAWKGYEHRTTKGERGRTGEAGEDRTWELCLLGDD